MSRRVSCNPSTDQDFCDAARAALEHLNRTDPAHVEASLANALRAAFPLVEVHRQTELARVFDDDVWYVYRDGRPLLGTAADPD
jgi:hypothetical protein